MMIKDQRHVGLRTTFDLLKQNPLLIILGTFFTSIPLFALGIFVLILNSAGSDVPKVDYDSVIKNGTAIKAVITGIEAL